MYSQSDENRVVKWNFITLICSAPPYLPPWMPEAAWARMDFELVQLIS